MPVEVFSQKFYFARVSGTALTQVALSAIDYLFISNST